jgi:hypothetical protein
MNYQISRNQIVGEDPNSGSITAQFSHNGGGVAKVELPKERLQSKGSGYYVNSRPLRDKIRAAVAQASK